MGTRQELDSKTKNAGTPAATPHRSGFVCIIGRPNAGKSTLLNRLLGRKIAIVTPKPQTTRRRILGIKTLPDAQLILVDTPGIHRASGVLNRRMVEVAERALKEADLVLWIVDAGQGPAAIDERIVALLRRPRVRACIALNKIDALRKPDLLPLMQALAEKLPDCEIVPISARDGENVDSLVRTLVEALPPGPKYYPDDEITDQTEREIAAEVIREKVLLETRQEVPYGVAVTVEAFEEKPGQNLVVIHAAIQVNRKSQKPILLGHKGAKIKRIGQLARAELERELGRRVFLELFVRVDEDWTTNARRLKELGL